MLRYQGIVLANRFKTVLQACQLGGQVVDTAIQFLIGFARVDRFAECEQLLPRLKQLADRFPFFGPAQFQLADGQHIGRRFAFQAGDAFAVFQAGGLFAAQPLQLFL
ncbi:hypothetical protein D9M68_889310 [compost metagenome]